MQCTLTTNLPTSRPLLVSRNLQTGTTPHNSYDLAHSSPPLVPPSCSLGTVPTHALM